MSSSFEEANGAALVSSLISFRRGHRKSRKGCCECKRRHIKCDEKHPICSHCIMGERKCDYRENRSKTAPAKAVTMAIRRAPSSPESSPQCSDSADTPVSNPNLLKALDQSQGINMLHMELLAHFSNETFIPEIGQELHDASRLAVKAGLDASYLMHEILAISARHLAYLHPSNRDRYLQEALQLQGRAISLFIAEEPHIDESSCVAKLLFSSILGRHLLSDVLANRDVTFDTFLDSYLRYARLHSGVRTITAQAFPLLMESELRSAICWGTSVLDIPARGHHCNKILALVSSANIDEESIKACQKAIGYLQIGFDELERGNSRGSSIQMIFWWSALVPEEFIKLLKRRQPEAIAVFGYYAALLCHGEKIWQIGDAGIYLSTSITQYLGHDWVEWLPWPGICLKLDGHGHSDAVCEPITNNYG